METFTDRFRFLLRLADMTATEAASASGVSVQTVVFFSSGRRDNPTAETARALAKGLGCTVGWLLAGEGEAPTAADIQAARIGDVPPAPTGDGQAQCGEPDDQPDDAPARLPRAAFDLAATG